MVNVNSAATLFGERVVKVYSFIVQDCRALQQAFRQETQEKKASQGKVLNIFFRKYFLLHTLKTTFWMENLTQRWAQSGSFSPKSGHFFDFQKIIYHPSSYLIIRGWLLSWSAQHGVDMLILEWRQKFPLATWKQAFNALCPKFRNRGASSPKMLKLL